LARITEPSGETLTHFAQRRDENASIDKHALTIFPRWNFLAGEVEETEKELIVRVEVPSIEKSDWQITIEGNVLYLNGEKRLERESHDSIYHITERAYGVFQRSIPLPRNVDIENVQAIYKNGVLVVKLPKLGGSHSRKIHLS